jgi:glycopeptide antibiotics resistance protein
MATNLYRWRHLALLISILLVFIISPLLVTFRHGVLILNVIGAMVVLAGAYTLSERKHLFTIAIVLSAVPSPPHGCLSFSSSIGRYCWRIHASLF